MIEIQNEPKNSEVMREIRSMKLSPYIYPGLNLVLVRSVQDKIELIKLILNRHHNGVTWDQANTSSGKRPLVAYRHHLTFLLLKYTNYSLTGVAKCFKGRNGKAMDHSSIVYARDACQNLIDVDRKSKAIHAAVMVELNVLIK